MQTATPIASLALLIMLTGCSVLPERPQPPALHDFGATPGSAAATLGTASSVSVSAPEWLMSDQIHYRFTFEDPTRVRYYSLDRWLAPPPSLLSQRLASGVSSEGQLHVRLLDFEQIFDAPRTARVIMRFRASFKADGIGTTEQEFRLNRLCPTPDAKGAVTAFAVLVDDSVDKIRDWVDKQRAFSSGRFRTLTRP